MTGYDPRFGRDRLFCADAEPFTPNVWLGNYRVSEELVLVDDTGVTTGDFSLEGWFLYVELDAVHERTYTLLGSRFERGHIALENATGDLEIRYNVGATDVAATTAATLGSWQHLAANFDRNGTATLYVNGLLAATTGAINATNVSPAQFLALSTPGGGAVLGHNYVAGPVAGHNRLLTALEIEDAYHGRTVNNFNPTDTLCYFDWTNVTGNTGWDTDITHMDSRIENVAAYAGYHVGIPEGTSWRIQDGSGNNNDMIAAANEGALASYSAASRAPFGFAYSTYFPT